MPSIPASNFVNVIANVVGVGGSGLDLVGLFLTGSTRVPIGTVQRFTTAAAVATFFGPTAPETDLARAYFGGYTRSTIKPAVMLFSQYAAQPVAAYLQGGNVSGLTLAQLQALTGVLTITVDGTAKTSGTVNLQPATSFSNAAAIIQAAFTNPGFTVSYDSVSGGFVFTNTDTGVASTISVASGTLSVGLALTQSTGAVLSQGAGAMTPGSAMAGVTAISQNFATFSTVFKPAPADMVAFATWTAGQAQRFVYAAWDSDPAATLANDTTSFAYQVGQLGLSGTVAIWDPNSGGRIAAFLMGALASINFGGTNARTSAAYLTGSGIPAGVTNATIAANLEANGWNYYGAVATANSGFNFFYPGQISGPFLWIDTYINQVWMNAQFQIALLRLLTAVGQVPYNADGYAQIEASLLPAINAALAFGAIRPGVTLSVDQIAAVNNLAQKDVATTLATRGWYVLVQPASPAVRQARSTPPVYFWYCDGQSVQRITMSSLTVE